MIFKFLFGFKENQQSGVKNENNRTIIWVKELSKYASKFVRCELFVVALVLLLLLFWLIKSLRRDIGRDDFKMHQILQTMKQLTIRVVIELIHILY